MQIHKFIEDSDQYSVPFDWDDDDNIDYVSNIVDTYFDKYQRVGDNWQPTLFGIIAPRVKVGDLGTLAGSERIVFSQRAVDALRPLLGTSVELLPYPTEIGTYYLVNVLDVGDYLDKNRTKCREILPNGLCAGISKFVFQADLLRGKHIFRIPDSPVFRYVSDEFIAACRKHNLTGIDMTEEVKVWDSAIV
ncbi:imm11 family protein [Hymenobacter cellulosilyticus]|uniref:Immunity MXAN-0049 protein domain-containing protein n=1 Tax=Hymenobacter cellulosilyticus TaxID=2932248 RepID=A0A8T9QD09_9BACT|nr:DUF1629 domain-containing protein [Hymenobacter cellulosilyticus]UOQ74802.1 hypothetical protein MUN79_13585 [Hymenobacter cellulosilyticus]